MLNATFQIVMYVTDDTWCYEPLKSAVWTFNWFDIHFVHGDVHGQWCKEILFPSFFICLL